MSTINYIRALAVLGLALVAGAGSALESTSGPAASGRTADTSKSAATPAGIKTIGWEDLVPPGYRPDELMREYGKKVAKLKDGDPRAQELAEELRRQWESAPVVESLNNKLVKLTGYLVTLDTDGKAISEFLLVPYFGSCIHVPPPPSNQIVLVRTGAKPYPFRQVFDVVSVTGRLKTEFAHNELASASYVIEATKIERQGK